MRSANFIIWKIVCLPFSVMMSSSNMARTLAESSSFTDGRNSSNIGSITSGQPSRISDSVPSKSNTTC